MCCAQGTEDQDVSTPWGMTVGWLNHMAAPACGFGDAGCLWQHAKLTPHVLAISSEDFSSWLEDAKAVLAHATGCPPFLVNFRFVGVSGGGHEARRWGPARMWGWGGRVVCNTQRSA